jgi:steroid delta-isomerase-like uncharacterized protein
LGDRRGTAVEERAMSATNDERAGRLESNRALGRRFFGEQDRLKGGPAPELCAKDYTARIGGNPAMDRAGHEGFARAFYGAFPDIHHEVEIAVAEEDAVAVRFVLHGTHTAPFFGIPATNRKVAIAGHAFLRLGGGQVTSLVAVFDEAGLLRQLGVLPSG